MSEGKINRDKTPLGMARINEQQFLFLTDYLARKYGLKLKEDKKTLLESRLYSRINKLGMRSIDEYIQFVFKNEQGKNEYQFFVDIITTHKTFFFRENHQFAFMVDFLKNSFGKSITSNHINIWSAGCSTGEEVYTLAMLLNENKSSFPKLDFKIVGTDISIPSLQKAAKGEYSDLEVNTLNEEYRNKYFKPFEQKGLKAYRFSHPELKTKIKFGILNLNKPQYNLPFQFDIIFCRNVIIYFDLRTQKLVLEKLVSKLKPNGFLFLGHSESAIGSNLPIKSIRPTIYQKTH